MNTLVVTPWGVTMSTVIMKQRSIGCALVALVSLTVVACSSPRVNALTPEVRTLSANANFGKGDFGSYANRADFKGQRHLYAVGPVQHLGGEVLVIDSVPYAVEVADGRLRVTSSWEYQPPFLVYSQVARWIAIPGDVTSYAQLGVWIGKAAVQNGVAEGEPFAFQIQARPAMLRVSVMNRPVSAIPGDKPTSAYATREIGGQDTEFVGFYSTRHAGVFLGSGERVHIHVSDVNCCSWC